jgi:hypothetical protein
MFIRIALAVSGLAVAFGENCSRETWIAMNEKVKEANFGDAGSFFMTAASEHDAAAVVVSELDGAIMADSTALTCHACFVNKYKALFPIFKGQQAECKDGFGGDCEKVMKRISREFEYCELMTVAGRCSDSANQRIISILQEISRTDIAAASDSAGTFRANIQTAALAKSSWIISEACWKCHEDYEAAIFGIYKKTSVACTAPNQPPGCVDLSAASAVRAECLSNYANPPDVACSAKVASNVSVFLHIAKEDYYPQKASSQAAWYANLAVHAEAEGEIPVTNARRLDCYQCWEPNMQSGYTGSDVNAPCEGSIKAAFCIMIAFKWVPEICMSGKSEDTIAETARCDVKTYMKLIGLVEGHNFSTAYAALGSKPETAPLEEFWTSAVTDKTITAAEKALPCVECITNRYATVLAAKAKMTGCSGDNPPAACADTVIATNTADDDFKNCLYLKLDQVSSATSWGTISVFVWAVFALMA